MNKKGGIALELFKSLFHVTIYSNDIDKTIAFYEKLGFTRLREEKIDIGGGFFMDDYVYRYAVEEGEGK